MGLVTRLATVLLGSVALSGLSVGLAAAQNQNTKNVTLLERLVIGSGAAKVAIDTPQAVTVVDQKDIDDKQASTTGEIFDEIPGVTMIGSERPLGESFNIRGIGESEVSGDEARIIITVDGAKKFYEQYRMGSFFSDPELYKRVEVLRGPASSTLYGSGAFGGVINFTTKDASDFIADGQTGAVRVKGSYDSNGNGTLTSAILAHRINETFEVLASGNFRRSDLQRLANGGTLTGSDFEAWSGLVKGTMHLDDEQVVRLSHQRWNSEGEDQPYSQTDPQNFGTVDRTVNDQTTVLAYENPASDDPMLDLKVQLSYSDTDVKQSDSAGFSPDAGNANYGYKTVQLNVQNTSELSGDNWVNYITYGVQASNQHRIAKPNVGGFISTHPEGTSTNLGIFAQTEHTIDDRLTLIAGARGDYSYIAPSQMLTPVNAPFGELAFSPKVAALYKFNDNFNVFGSAAHTERIPTLDERFQYTSSRWASPNLKKELSDNFEVGFGTQGFDFVSEGDSVGFKATGFYNNITDGVRVNPDQSGSKPYFVNIPGMRLWGLELEGSYESEMAFARLAYTFTRGEYTQSFNGVGTGGAPAPSRTRNAGDPVDSLPQDKLVLTVGGRIPEQQLEYGAKVTVAAAPIAYVNTSTGKPDGWAKLDIFANWKPQEGPLAGLEAQFGIDNVFDADYRENLSQERSKGRTFKLTLAKQFDY